MNKELLMSELRKLMKKVLELDEPISVGDNENLFTSELEIDPIDVLELESAIKKQYHIETEKFEKEGFLQLGKLWILLSNINATI